jgi:hypothetical protein
MGYCEYCHTDVDGYIKPLDKNAHLFISPNIHPTIVVNWYGHRKEVEITYCPMCGRDLTKRGV